MSLNKQSLLLRSNQYNFLEAKLGPDFAQDKLKEFKALIDSTLSFVVISMPGVGVSYFLNTWLARILPTLSTLTFIPYLP